MDFVTLVVSLMLVFCIASYVVDSQNFSDGEKRAHFFLLSYFVPALLALAAGFTGQFHKEFFLGVLSISVIGIILVKRSLPRFSFLKVPININSENIFPVLIVAYYFMKAVTISVWVSLDDTTYHAAIPAQWVQWGSFSVPVLTYQIGFPLNGSLFSSFLLSFTRSEFVAAISELFIILIMVSYVSLKKNTLLMLALCFIFSTTDVEKYLVGFSDSDILSGVLIYVLFSNLIETKGNRIKEFLSSITLGFLFGIKLLNVIFLLPLMPRMIKSWTKFKYKKSSIFTFLLIGAPWYIRDLVVFKNPFFPFEKYGFSGWMSPELMKKTTLLSAWAVANIDMKLIVLKGFLGWQPLSFWLGVLFLSTVFMGILRKTEYSVTILLSFLLFLIMFLGAPFSGLNESLKENISVSRYLIPLFIPGILIIIERFDFRLENNSKIKYLAYLLLSVFFLIPRHHDKKTILVVMVFLLLLLLFKKVQVRSNFNLIILPVLCLFLIQFRASKNTEASKNDTVWFLKTVNSLRESKNISMYNHFIFQSYYLAGNGLRHKVFRLKEDGEVIRKTEGEIDEGFFFMGTRSSTEEINCTTFFENLKKSAIDILVVEKMPINPQEKCIKDNKRYLVLNEQKEGFVVQVI